MTKQKLEKCEKSINPSFGLDENSTIYNIPSGNLFNLIKSLRQEGWRVNKQGISNLGTPYKIQSRIKDNDLRIGGRKHVGKMGISMIVVYDHNLPEEELQKFIEEYRC